MASRTLLQLFTLSIIFTDQIEARCLNKTHNSDNLECAVNSTLENKRSAKVNERDEDDTLLIKKTYPDQRSDTNLESKYDILARCKYNFKSKHIENEETDSNKAEDECDEHIKLKTTTPVKKELTSFKNRKDISNEEKNSGHAHKDNSNNIIQKTDIEKIKHYRETKHTSNEESSLPNKGQEDHETVKKQKHMLTIKHHNTEKRTTQKITDKPLIPKRIHSWTTEVDDERCKTKHCDYTNHRSVERLSQENDIYRLRHEDEITTEIKDDNELKHHYSKRNKSSRKLLLSDKESVKKRDNSHTLSKENEIYKLENRVDIPSVEMPVTKKAKPKYKPKFTHNFQKKRLSENVSDKTKYKSKIKHDKVVSKEEKPTKNGKKEKHTEVRKGKYNVKSEDTLNPDKKDAQSSSVSNDDEKETLDSSQESLQQNNLPYLKKPRLPFYVTSQTLTKKEIAKKYPKKQVLKKDDAEILSDDLNEFLIGKTNLRNKKIDINKVMDQLASSKMLDFITDRVADHMLKKLHNNQAFKSHITTTDEEPEKVEKIDIVFKNDGDMVMKKAENVKI